MSIPLRNQEIVRAVELKKEPIRIRDSEDNARVVSTISPNEGGENLPGCKAARTSQRNIRVCSEGRSGLFRNVPSLWTEDDY